MCESYLRPDEEDVEGDVGREEMADLLPDVRW
jgi:hypothetical protein